MARIRYLLIDDARVEVLDKDHDSAKGLRIEPNGNISVGKYALNGGLKDMIFGQ